MSTAENTAIRYLLTAEDELLVKRTARRVAGCNPGAERRQLEEELCHYGFIGLLEAKKSFDRTKEIPFSAFAVHRIKGAMVDYLRTAPIIRLPQKQQELRKQLEEARRDLDQRTGEESDDSLAGHLGWTTDEVRRVAAFETRLVSLSAPMTGDNPGRNEEGPDWDLPAAAAGPESKVLRQELVVVVQTCLKKIRSARDRLILVGRVLHDKKLRELAEGLGCTMETVRLRQEQALESMKRCLRVHGWDNQDLDTIAG